MPKPTPATLRSCADQLRILAAKHEQHAQHCDDLLADVVRLTGPDTWSGPYADQAGSEFGRWRSGLTATATELRLKAADWRRTADHFDAQANVHPISGAAS